MRKKKITKKSTKKSTKKLTTEIFIKRSFDVHGNKYNYEESNFISIRNKIKIICPEHGEFFQLPISHMNGHGCVRCGGKKVFNKKDFVNNVADIHGDKYDYSEFNYIGSTKKGIIRCKKHNYKFLQTSNKHLLGRGCPICGVSRSTGEEKIKRYLEDNSIYFIHHHYFDDCISPFSDQKLEYDFYLPHHNIAIEFDGIYHFKSRADWKHTDRLKKTKIKDKCRDIYCKKNNIKLIRISYKEDNIEKILSKNLRLKMKKRH